MLRPFGYWLLIVLLAAGCNNQSETQDNEANRPVTTNGELSPDDSVANNGTPHAVCVLQPVGDSGVSGTVHFTEQGDTVQVRGEITGLSPGKHGFHIHEHGDLSDQETGESAGGHFNPTDQPHGAPSDSERHVGDLGNLEADENGTADIHIDDDVIQLDGPHSIVGRAVVVHSGQDQFTQPSGDAGDRVALGVIEAAEQ